jgi:hypothetical protein
MKSGHRIKNWKLLANTESKKKLIRFLAESWKEENVRKKKLGAVKLIVNNAENCSVITKDAVRFQS